MWEVWSLSQSLRVRPSDALGLRDRFVAFCVDRAVWTFAKTVEEAMDQAESRLPKNAKDRAHVNARQRVLDQYLGVVASEQPSRFRSPGG